jgi:hypothetical protein
MQVRQSSTILSRLYSLRQNLPEKRGIAISPFCRQTAIAFLPISEYKGESPDHPPGDSPFCSFQSIMPQNISVVLAAATTLGLPLVQVGCRHVEGRAEAD